MSKNNRETGWTPKTCTQQIELFKELQFIHLKTESNFLGRNEIILSEEVNSSH